MTPAPREPRTSPARTREVWVDVAKGAAIVLVVLFHAGGSVPDTTAGGRAWEQLNVVLVSIRMPLFFLVSGLFVGRALTEPAGRFLRRRAWPPLYLFGLWTLLSGGLAIGTSGAVGEPALDSVAMQTTLWYLAALSLYLAVARLLAGVRPAVQIGASAVLALPFAVWLPFEWGGLGHIPHYLVCFLVGCYGRHRLAAVVNGTGRWAASAVVATCGALLVLAVAMRVLVPGVQELQAVVLFVLLPVVAVPVVLLGCGALARRRPGRWLSRLGQHTLPIFLLHPMALQLLDLAGAEAAAETGAVAWVLPLLLTAGAMSMSVLAWHVMEMYAPWLFTPRVRLGRHSARRAAPAAVVPDVAGVPSPRSPAPAVNPSAASDEPDTPPYGLARTPGPPYAHPAPARGPDRAVRGR